MASEIEIEFEDAKRGVKFRVKGSPEVVDAYLEKYGYASAMKEAATRKEERVAVASVPVPSMNSKEYFQIPEKPEAGTLSEYITKIMYTEWGKVGRTSSDILEAAATHGVPMPMSTLSGLLHMLTRNGKLRRSRQMDDPQWKYFPSLSYSLGKTQ